MKLQTINDRCLRKRITVSGIVQGVGFRPFVYRIAKLNNLAGWVINNSRGVIIEIEGSEREIDAFIYTLKTDPPPLALISDISIEDAEFLGDLAFTINHSEDNMTARTSVPSDIAACDDCISDISDPSNRRYRYPFTNCTNCGPRFTIIESVPYDRPKTTMRGFKMCPACQTEYEDPADRRFHAQPNACPVCGPHLVLDGMQCDDDYDALRRVGQMLQNGEIVALKGLGGYHLACDARSSDAVEKVRMRKGRAGKPLALMCADIDETRRVCEIDENAERLLLSRERPIVLMKSRLTNDISPLVAGDTPSLGIMLPYTPLHQLLLECSPRSLVMTSGNLNEEPIVYDDNEVNSRLGHIADHVLSNNRPVHVACDDSVMKIHNGVPMFIRRSRGYVPRPISIPLDLPDVFAVGGDLKNTFCLIRGNDAYMSQHLGDLENVATMDHFQHVFEHYCKFFDAAPTVVAHDLHPGYSSTSYALSLKGVKKIGVQHHHAHIASCMAENGLDEPVIGLAFDGTGYGTDGNIWGGEFLLADYHGFNRMAHLTYVPLPGGEASIRKPSRIALSYILQSCKDVSDEHLREMIPSLSIEEIRIVRTQIQRGLNTPITSSMGRLFDAVSAILGICLVVTYEGQAAIELEADARIVSDKRYHYGLSINALGETEIDFAPVLSEIVSDMRDGLPVDEIAGAFHLTVADAALRVCEMIREYTGVNKAALSGGVFQNSLLLDMVESGLSKAGFEVFIHRKVPTNDGGISLGQAMIAGKGCIR